MNRRSFLAAIAGALAFDPERALWVPGKKLISIPAPAPLEQIFRIIRERYFVGCMEGGDLGRGRVFTAEDIAGHIDPVTKTIVLHGKTEDIRPNDMVHCLGPDPYNKRGPFVTKRWPGDLVPDFPCSRRTMEWLMRNPCSDPLESDEL